MLSDNVSINERLPYQTCLKTVLKFVPQPKDNAVTSHVNDISDLKIQNALQLRYVSSLWEEFVSNHVKLCLQVCVDEHDITFAVTPFSLKPATSVTFNQTERCLNMKDLSRFGFRHKFSSPFSLKPATSLTFNQTERSLTIGDLSRFGFRHKFSSIDIRIIRNRTFTYSDEPKTLKCFTNLGSVLDVLVDAASHGCKFYMHVTGLPDEFILGTIGGDSGKSFSSSYPSFVLKTLVLFEMNNMCPRSFAKYTPDICSMLKYFLMDARDMKSVESVELLCLQRCMRTSLPVNWDARTVTSLSLSCTAALGSIAGDDALGDVLLSFPNLTSLGLVNFAMMHNYSVIGKLSQLQQLLLDIDGSMVAVQNGFSVVSKTVRHLHVCLGNAEVSDNEEQPWKNGTWRFFDIAQDLETLRLDSPPVSIVEELMRRTSASAMKHLNSLSLAELIDIPEEMIYALLLKLSQQCSFLCHLLLHFEVDTNSEELSDSELIREEHLFSMLPRSVRKFELLGLACSWSFLLSLSEDPDAEPNVYKQWMSQVLKLVNTASLDEFHCLSSVGDLSVISLLCEKLQPQSTEQMQLYLDTSGLQKSLITDNSVPTSGGFGFCTLDFTTFNENPGNNCEISFEFRDRLHMASHNIDRLSW